ncbi:somatoliberin [Scleropages formosus]|uniref:somatoliberin n=1 Tax=Scleropages formosus TaxID=113540 RepID=UPI0008789B6A|nr:somatoliberin [Scleropages formosus]
MHKIIINIVSLFRYSEISAPVYRDPGKNKGVNESELRFGQRASESPILISSSTRDPSQAPGTESSAPPRGQTKQRFGRHADAIFTNSYRKVLGQISARKFLQTIMGKRLGVGDARHYAKRQSDIFEDMFKQDLTTILREQKIKRWQLDVNRPR